MMLETVVPPSICRDMQHAATEYARHARDKIEEDEPASMTKEQDSRSKPPFVKSIKAVLAERESQSETKRCSLFLNHSRAISNLRAEDELLFSCYRLSRSKFDAARCMSL